MTKPVGGQLLWKLGVMTSGTAASIVLGIVQSVVAARLLGPAGLARYATIVVAANLIAQLSDCGLANALGYYARRHPGAGVSLLRLLIKHLAALLSVLVVAGLLIAESGWPIRTDTLWEPWFWGPLIVLIAATSATTLFSVLLLARGDYTAYVGFGNGILFLHLVGIVIAYSAFGRSWAAFVTAIAIAQVLTAAVEFLYVRGRLAAADAEVVPASVCYTYGLKIKWAEVMKLLSGRADLLVVAAVLPSAHVGVYSIALALREFGMTPFRTYSGILQNLIVDRHRDGADDGVLVVGSLLLQSCVSIGVCVLAAVAFPYLLPLVYGHQYDALAGPAVVALLATSFLSVAGICWTVFNMLGRPTLTSAIVTVSGLAGVPMVYLLARSYGLYGAASAGTLNAAATAVISLATLFHVRGYGVSTILTAVWRLRELSRTIAAGSAASPAKSVMIQ